VRGPHDDIRETQLAGAVRDIRGQDRLALDRRHDQLRVERELEQGGRIEVVRVRVGDQERVGLAEVADLERLVVGQVLAAAREHVRIDHHTRRAGADDDRVVPEERQLCSLR
jgi:hypothetical protein